MTDAPVLNRHWRRIAECRDADAPIREAFFGTVDEQTAMVSAYCVECTVRVECLSDARKYEHNTDALIYGVRGGLTEYQRRHGRRLRLAPVPSRVTRKRQECTCAMCLSPDPMQNGTSRVCS
jgi:Transcription factor WhiB